MGTELLAEASELEVVHAFGGPMPTGVAVSRTGRIFVNVPKWGDEMEAAVPELRDGKLVPFPDRAWNSPARDDDPGAPVSVQSVLIDPADRLWILDAGSARPLADLRCDRLVCGLAIHGRDHAPRSRQPGPLSASVVSG